MKKEVAEQYYVKIEALMSSKIVLSMDLKTAKPIIKRSIVTYVHTSSNSIQWKVPNQNQYWSLIQSRNSSIIYESINDYWFAAVASCQLNLSTISFKAATDNTASLKTEYDNLIKENNLMKQFIFDLELTDE